MYNQYVELIESVLSEGRDGVELLDKGHVAYAKKKMKQGPEALAKYFEHLKKNELTRLPEAGKENYIVRLKRELSVKEATQCDEESDEEDQEDDDTDEKECDVSDDDTSDDDTDEEEELKEAVEAYENITEGKKLSPEDAKAKEFIKQHYYSEPRSKIARALNRSETSVGFMIGAMLKSGELKSKRQRNKDREKFVRLDLRSLVEPPKEGDKKKSMDDLVNDAIVKSPSGRQKEDDKKKSKDDEIPVRPAPAWMVKDTYKSQSKLW